MKHENISIELLMLATQYYERSITPSLDVFKRDLWYLAGVADDGDLLGEDDLEKAFTRLRKAIKQMKEACAEVW